MKTLEKVNIVEYHDGLADSVAKMWNESRENWGGDSVVTTKQDVMEDEANSTNLHLFLATFEGEVVGYCGLSEYRDDQGALYIPLINVHPDYQGMKIGKELLIKALEKTVEYRWPRLDLYTWPGNTKAVPLYKKCGFFWEERDDTTHLMNFMPTVLQLDWLRPFFDKHGWYTTSQRVIEIKPDGIKEKDHTFYEYKWEAGDEFVRVQFERTGRGIRLIETQDVLVEMNLSEFKLLEKDTHEVKYRVVNKASNQVHVGISGESSDLVNHNIDEKFEIQDEWSGSFPLSVNVPKNEPSPWKTHPVVCANIEINGSPIPFKMGVFPIKAGKMDVRSVKKSWRSKQEGTLYLDMESTLDEEATWTFNLPVNDVVKWDQSEVNTTIAEKGRVSLPLSCQLLRNGFLDEEVEVRVQRKSGEQFFFTSKLSLAFPGFGGKFGGETDTHWYGYNGSTYVEIEKRNHLVRIGSVRAKEKPMLFLTPKIGKPYSDELSKKEAKSVEYIELPESFVVKTTMESEAFASLILNTYFVIYGDGLVEIKHELINDGEEEKQDVFLSQPVFQAFKQMAIPQKDGVMIGDEAVIPFMEYIRDKDISERWLFTSSTHGESKGIAWPENAAGKRDDWRFKVEYPVGTLGSHQKTNFGPIQVGVDTSPTWKQWRELVLGEEVADIQEKSVYSLEAKNRGFISTVGDNVDYTFRSMLTPHVYGALTVETDGKAYVKEASQEESVTKLDLQLDYQSPGVKGVSGQFRSPGQRADLHSIHLVKGKDEEVEISREEDRWIVNNGVLSFKASSAYYPGIYSLQFNGKETLHHQYPEPGPKAWWNPWGGGLGYSFRKASHYSMLKEKTEVDPVTKVDHLGHKWKGICITTTLTEHEEMKGVTLRQYALTLPEVPVLALYGEIQQDSNRTFPREKLDFEAFFKPGENLSSCFANLETEGVFHTYYAGAEEYVLKDTPTVTIGSDEREEKLILTHPDYQEEAEMYMNQDVFLVESSHEWSAASGDVTAVKPTILLFDEEDQIHPEHHPFHGLSFR